MEFVNTGILPPDKLQRLSVDHISDVPDQSISIMPLAEICHLNGMSLPSLDSSDSLTEEVPSNKSYGVPRGSSFGCHGSCPIPHEERPEVQESCNVLKQHILSDETGVGYSIKLKEPQRGLTSDLPRVHTVKTHHRRQTSDTVVESSRSIDLSSCPYRSVREPQPKLYGRNEETEGTDKV